MKLSKLAVVLMAIVLAIGSVQCVAACTPTDNAAPPPCHHHKQPPASQKTAACAHELVPATIVQPSFDHVTFSAEIVDAPSVSSALVSAALPEIRRASPPWVRTGSLSILRI